MQEENINTITYEENWNKASVPEYPQIIPLTDNDNYEQVNQTNDSSVQFCKKVNNSPKQLLITIQLIICIIIALSAFVVKGLGGEIYSFCREWYYSNLNNSVIFDTNTATSDIAALLDIFGTDEN